MQSHVLAALVFERYVWYFGSLHPAFEMSCDTEYLKKQLLIFFGNVVSVVLYCVQLFWWFSHKPSEKYWPISPKAKHKISKKTLSTFQKNVSRTSSDLSTWNNTCFLFECRVKFRLRQTSKATFGTLALYILRLRCLGISNTYKNSFCFLSKIETFQNDVEYVPKMFFWALLGLFLWW